MNERNRDSLRALFGAVLVWQCCGAVSLAQGNGQTYPPPVGVGIVATLQADQEVYTNQSAQIS